MRKPYKGERLAQHMHHYQPGDTALIRGSFEVVDVIAQFDMDVLVRRAGGQTTYSVLELEPYDPDFCPLD
jgi:hypothetical protein